MGEALTLSKDLAENDSNYNVWTNSHGKIGRLVGTEPRIASMKANRQTIGKLQNLYMDVRRNKIMTEAIMRTYTKLKPFFVKEKYLGIKDGAVRSALTRIRISAHNLAIERGRYVLFSRGIGGRVC